MLKAALIVATVVALGCPSSPPIAQPKPYDDVAIRIRIARLEARRAAGVNELEELAHGGDVRQRVLALRGLGRIGSPQVVEFLKHQHFDSDDRILAAALAALGVAGALDDTAPLDGIFAPPNVLVRVAPDAPTETLTREQQIALVEAVGRAGGVQDQSQLVRSATSAPGNVARAAIALAFGRMGRRKLALSPDVRAWLVTATSDADRDVRYGATYALMREHEPPPDEHVLAALAERVTDNDPEIRSLAIAALAKRGQVNRARKSIEDSLRDRDWRVAVEAVRALAGEHGDVAGKRAVAGILDLRWTELVAGHDEEAQIIVEALRVLAKPPSDAENIIHLIELARAEQLAQSTHPPRLVIEWTLCLAGAVWDSARGKFEHAAPCAVAPTIWGLTAIGDLVTAGFGAIADRRAALRRLLEHSDPRVRAAAIGALATLWKDGDANDRRTIVTTLIAALASRDPIIAGSAVDAAPGLYDAIGDQPEREQLDAAIVQRAANETDIELGASLFELIGKRAIGAGADACHAGLKGHIVRARAAAECLNKLGEAVPKPEIKATEPPPNIDVADVIGKDLRWHLTTSRGEIVIQLRPDVAPWNVATIVALTSRHFYDGLAFHRVVPDFVVQGGDPTQSGWGGPGFTTPAEPASALDGAGFTEGGVGIADAGRDSGGSQWFVMHSRAPHLDGRYTWIGSVISGQKSADALLIGDTVIRACVEMRNYGGSANVTSACK